MKISFVIPAHNEERLIGKCLKAILQEIERVRATDPAVETEVVVVDNASTDKTREEALKFEGVTVVREQLKGLVYARRAGFVATTGEVVANIDADTRMPPGWLSTVVSEFQNDPKLVALSGPYHYYDLTVVHRMFVKVFYFLAWVGHMVFYGLFGHGAVLQGGNFVLRRTAWESVGGFDVTIAFYGEDTDVARRISKAGKVKWTWKLPMHTSGRRLAKEGLLKMGYVYAINFFSTTVSGRPVTREYSDIRIDS